MRLSPFTSLQRLSCLGYHALLQNGNRSAKASSVSASFAGRTGFPPTLAIVSSNSAFILIREFFIPGCIGALKLTPIQPQFFYLTACYTPHRVSPLDKPWDDRLLVSPAFLDIFTYRLLKAAFNVHPYGRTIFSLILGLPEQSALISA